METGKPGLASAPVYISSIAQQTEKRMDIQSPLTAVYIQTVPAPTSQPSCQRPAATPEPAALHLPMPPLYSKETLPLLTLHIVGGLQSQPGLSLAAATPTARPKSAGKHVCPHCGRDCMKPSVLEKHLRCHTGERPYPCITCGVSFKTQSNLYKHKRTQAHARLSYESEQSSLGSLDSSSSSRDLHSSSLSLEERGKEAGSLEEDGSLAEAVCPATPKVPSKEELAGDRGEPPPAGHDAKTREATETTKEERQVMDRNKPPLSHGRHLPLQRQEATLFSKQWESSVCRGKSQSHESTDSGFSESSDHYPSPGSLIHDHSMDSLAESTKEHPEEATGVQAPSEPGDGGPPMRLKDMSREKEQKSLEERISKLISENTAVMEDKHLENVRPRKTVLSKQGSIDLPMPYTYKDSFHFDMRISKTPNVGSQRNKNPGFYSSVPTQHSSSTEHAPLTRSHSLPFSVTLLQPERSSPSSARHSDYATLARRDSAGQINQTSSAMKPVNQHSSAHRPLVRQTAVDCNHATDALFANSSVEEACAGSLSCDGDGGDICGEPSNRKFRRKKAQKFAYNKWYMYGGGTFKKLYNTDKGGDSSGIKGRKSTNPENEAVQGLQKRLSAVHKEPVSTTCSAMNFTSRCATVSHPGCPPAKLCALDFNRNRGQLLSSCGSAVTPLQRNLSLPVLPSPSAGSLVTQTTERMIRGESERLSDEGTHADSTSQLCGSLVPSDRKKQRTDDKIICPVEMETDANTPTPLPLPAAGHVPQQDTNLTFVNLQTNHTQPKESLFPPTLINANSQPVPFIAKNNFLPKYQLKLPNAAELDSSPTPSADKSAGTESSSTAPASSVTEQTPSLALTARRDPVSSPSTNLQERVPLLRTATALCQAANATPNFAVVQSSLAETTITTTCLHDHQTRLCSALAHNNPPKLSAVSSAVELHQPPTPTRTIKDYQTPAFSQGRPPTPTQETSEPSNLGDRFGSFGSNPPVVPCHIVPFDSVQPAGQNVFHVHTADLQICLQIISDEQLALIEPQIERQASGSRSQKHDMENVVSESKSPKLNLTNKEAGGPQLPAHQRDLEQSEFLQRTESIKSPLSVYFEMPKPNLHMSECSNPTPATVSAESDPPEARAAQLQPQKHGHVNTAAETPGGVGDTITAASFKGVNSRWSRAAEGEHALSVNHSAERQNLPDGRPSQGGLLSKVLPGQNKPMVTSPSPGTVNQVSARSELPVEESQNKGKNQGGSCKESTITSTDEASPGASAETRPSPQVRVDQGCVASCADKPSWTTVSTGKCKIPMQVDPQKPTHCGNPVISTPSGTLDSSKHALMEHGRVEPSDNSQNEISSVGPQHFTSGTSDTQGERPTEAQDPTAGRRGGASPLGRAAPDQLQAQGRGGRPGRPDGGERRPRSCPGTAAGETERWHSGGQDVAMVAGDSYHSGGASYVGGEAVAGRRGAAQSDGKHMLPPDTTKTQGGDGELRQDWRRSEQHLSQTHSGMCASPPCRPQPDPDPPDQHHVPAPSASPRPPAGHFGFSGQQQCEGQQAKIPDQPRPPSRGSAPFTQTFPQCDAGRQQTPARRAPAGLPGNGGVATCCCDTPTSGSHKITLADFTAGFHGDAEEAMWLETDAGARAARRHTSPSAEEGAEEGAEVGAGSKCEAIFLAAQLHGEQSGECLSGAVRPVLRCQGDAEDASSSDDEGKLIIEL